MPGYAKTSPASSPHAAGRSPASSLRSFQAARAIASSSSPRIPADVLDLFAIAGYRKPWLSGSGLPGWARAAKVLRTAPRRRLRALRAGRRDRRGRALARPCRPAPVEVPSAERIAPACEHFGVCGGCALQHVAGARYRDWKRGLVVAALARAGIDAPVDDLIDAHGEGRRRAVFHARRSARDVLEVGFAALKAHHVVPIDRCPVLAPALSSALPTARDIAEVLASTRKPLDIQVTATDAGLDVDVRGSGPLTAAQTTALAQVAERRNLVRLTRHGEIVAQRTPPVLTIGRAEVVLPPGAFLQATTAGEAVLARLVALHCRGAKAAADLFCGVGPFALRLAERARVSALDSDADALAALRLAAAGTAGLKPVTAQQRDLFRYPLGR